METKDTTLIQLLNEHDGTEIGLYRVPNDNLQKFFKQIEEVEEQADFDENNNIGVVRIYVQEEILTVKF